MIPFFMLLKTTRSMIKSFTTGTALIILFRIIVFVHYFHLNIFFYGLIIPLGNFWLFILNAMIFSVMPPQTGMLSKLCTTNIILHMKDLKPSSDADLFTIILFFPLPLVSHFTRFTFKSCNFTSGDLFSA